MYVRTEFLLNLDTRICDEVYLSFSKRSLEIWKLSELQVVHVKWKSILK
jgi:hypothetical protein